ncbi:D-threonate kinase [Shimwellia blattae]|uniref:Putative inner membrane protein n=1 Tax=Shimwellia blattae (strain ATCC 29907 / DSM 4481 / JCM 1650 / NBRC 105725 / CDC 9005-74) TaxID=630626 RepID=I2BCP3_SHIBC|nr:four-carbon acid sugar kinase family protein [Shimwellia blattae]AFJ48297.1 putative inner membrane protein [Shimwellia blattae DSM 4481 = NBRC 105725]GAB80992.1 hypothetical protein EB105725_11_00740 [Shimwellia blattae DSM 4481 = NBRC 105725]VDY65793.1 Uncharacterized protein conserved in bacteria [Shimwellia blattae]VEC25789.1 Uncharacterized protein conserved in bacteria [Shimwellia blattae]
MKMVVIADDFTGANDTGVQLARKGARTDVLLSERQSPLRRCDVLVINTESRALPADQARQRVQAALAPWCGGGEAVQIYKKIDSTFRGNVGAEIEAAMAACGAVLAIVAAAIPAAGRTTHNGRCLVNGVPLDETEFASDPKTPIVSSRIKTLISQQTRTGVQELDLATLRSPALPERLKAAGRSGPCILVVDAESDADLALLARHATALTVPYLLVGAAGLANTLDPRLFMAPRQPLPVLVVAGSMSEATREQIAFAAREDAVGIVDIDVASLTGSEPAVACRRWVAEAVALLQARRHCVLRTCRDSADRHRIDGLCARSGLSRRQLGERISRALGEITVDIIRNTRPGGLFLTGGDMAIAVARALGAEGYRIAAEVAPCVPCGTFINSDIDDLPVITKAGGFGGITTLRDALHYVEEMYSGK